MHAIITDGARVAEVIAEAHRQFPRAADRIGCERAANGRVAVTIPETIVARDGWTERAFRAVEATA